MTYDLKPVLTLAEARLNVKGEPSVIKKIYDLKIPEIAKTWPNQRKLVAYVQTILKAEINPNLVVDGWYGEESDNAIDIYFNGKVDWRSDIPDYEHIDDVYGDISIVSKKIVQITPAYDHFLAWAPKTKASKISCHERIADEYNSILKKVLSTYGKDRICELRLNQFGGSYVSPPRLMRGGRKYSTHCWGIAFDYDPSHNQLKWGKDRASFAGDVYKDWRDIWKQNGAIGLGEAKNYDWMHWQFSEF